MVNLKVETQQELLELLTRARAAGVRKLTLGDGYLEAEMDAPEPPPEPPQKAKSQAEREREEQDLLLHSAR